MMTQGLSNLGAIAYLNGYIQARNYGGAGERSLLGKSFAPPLENCVGHSLKNLGWSLLKKIFAPHIVPSWLRAWLHG